MFLHFAFLLPPVLLCPKSNMFLILSNDNDATALAVHKEMCRRQGADAVLLLTDADLLNSVGWSHVQQDMGTRTVLRLPDGRQLESDHIRAVFNRLRHLNPVHFKTLHPDDHVYALSEMFALLLSWQASLKCRVVNPASVRGLGGNNRSLLEWLKLAGESGIPTRSARFTTNARLVQGRAFSTFQPPTGVGLAQAAYFMPVPQAIVGQEPTLFLEAICEETERLLVIGKTVFGELREMADCCLALAERSNTQLLECIFVRSATKQEDVWRCGWINPFPELREPEISAVASFLENESST